MSLYTMIIDYRGGTYVTQAESDSLEHAPIACVQGLDTGAMGGHVKEQDKASILSALQEERVIPLADTTNCWCCSVDVHDHLMLMTLVLTGKAESL